MDMQKEREEFEAWFGNTICDLWCADNREVQMAWEAWQAAKADAEREFNNFLFEYKKALRKTYEDDKDNTHDYWRGFANCAKSSEIVLNEMIEAAQEQGQ